MLKEPSDSVAQQMCEHADEAPAVTPFRSDTSSDGPPAHCFEDAIAVARDLAPDIPLFCICEAALERQFAIFRDGFPGQVTYAVKANPSPQVINALVRCGIEAFDVASPAEMALVRDANPQSGLHYHNPVKSRAEITRALNDFDVRHFAIDDDAELDKIAELAGNPATIELAIRFRGTKNRAVCDFSTKFGASPRDAARLLGRADDLGFKTALTFHAGSQCLDPRAYVENIRSAADICRAAGVAIGRLNVGGGFPVDFPGHPVPPLREFFDAIARTAAAAFGDNVPELVCEPGRAMVAPAASLLARVKHRRPHADDLFLNDGIYGALMELTQVPVDLPCRVIRDGRVLGGPDRAFVLYGPTCDPVDRIPRSVVLPAGVSEGDWIEFGLLGAYGAATTTRFNGYGTIPHVNVRAVLTS